MQGNDNSMKNADLSDPDRCKLVWSILYFHFENSFSKIAGWSGLYL